MNHIPTIFISLIILMISGCTESIIEDDRRGESIPSPHVITQKKPNLSWFWEDEFSDQDHQIHKAWINTVFDASEETLGNYPYDLAVHFHHSSNQDKAVSFGYASRKKNPQVHFYVTPNYSLEELLEDWVAPHEISHLAVPFIGKDDQWFTEGFATFFSRQIMMNMGYYNQDEFDELYLSRIQEIEAYNSTSETFVEVANRLKSEHNYPHLYYGGTSYFMAMDLLLRERGMRFIEVIQKYQNQNRKKDKTMLDIVKSFDLIIGGSDCESLLIDYQTLPSFKVMAKFM